MPANQPAQSPETGPSDVIDERVLASLDAEFAAAEDRVCRDRRWAEAKRMEAESAAGQAAELAAVRKWVTPRIGMSWEDAIAEAEAELEKAKAAAGAAQEWLRDLIGHQRVLERRIADLKAQEAAAEDTATGTNRNTED